MREREDEEEEGMDKRRRQRRRRVCIRDKRLDLRRWDHTCDDDDDDEDEDDDNGYESMFSGYPGQFLVVPEAADISLQRGVRNIRRIADGAAVSFFSFFPRDDPRNRKGRRKGIGPERGGSMDRRRQESEDVKKGERSRERWTTGDVLDVLSLSS